MLRMARGSNHRLVMFIALTGASGVACSSADLPADERERTSEVASQLEEAVGEHYCGELPSQAARGARWAEREHGFVRWQQGQHGSQRVAEKGGVLCGSWRC